jgi:pimeloyl-ACP methyl ester carboxylesterase
MAAVPTEKERSQQARPDKSGKPTFSWQTTHTSVLDTVKLIMPPTCVLPIVFVPGIMGSNLCSTEGAPVWLLNSTGGEPIGLAWRWARKGPGVRQTILHPRRTKVYRNGAVPKKPVGTVHDRAEFFARGWGEVGEASYHGFLIWLEQKLNGEGFDPARWHDFYCESVSSSPAPGSPQIQPKLFPGIPMKMSGLPPLAEDRHSPESIMSDDLLNRSKFRFPVYACGYNWLASNDDAAERLKDKIEKIISENAAGIFKCKQVILVTHSMGGLVARACAQLPGMEEKIAGVVHGVMPAVGAAVAYRRCKIGMMDESIVAGLVVGPNGPAVTAVFAQAPGALQLLPSQEYGLRWLQINDETGKTVQRLPMSDPYAEIYLRQDRWWGLVKEEWLAPDGGTPIEWGEFAENINLAKDFHRRVSGKYHHHTFVFYGDGRGEQASFEKVTWAMKRGQAPTAGAAPTGAQTANFSHRQVRQDGENKIFVGDERKVEAGWGGAGFGDSYIPTSNLETGFWELTCLKQDGGGDGTVPASSGMSPREKGGKNVQQQFRLFGFSHEPAYKDPTAQTVTHYAITKIASKAKIA